MYSADIRGTIADAAWAMRRIPPMTTANTSAASTPPVTSFGMPIRLRADDTSKDWTPLPIPKPANMPNRAKMPASQLQPDPRPLRM